MFKTIYQLLSVFNRNAKKPMLSNQVKNTHRYLLFYCYRRDVTDGYFSSLNLFDFQFKVLKLPP